MEPKELMSLRRLAKLTGVAPTSVFRWVRHENWKFGAPPWPVGVLPAVRRWRKAILKPADQPVDFRGIERKRARLVRRLLQAAIAEINASVGGAAGRLAAKRLRSAWREESRR